MCIAPLVCAHAQGEELEPARAKAEKMGIKQIYIEDLREEFVRDYVFPMFRCVPPPCSLVSTWTRCCCFVLGAALLPHA